MLSGDNLIVSGDKVSLSGDKPIISGDKFSSWRDSVRIGGKARKVDGNPPIR